MDMSQRDPKVSNRAEDWDLCDDITELPATEASSGKTNEKAKTRNYNVKATGRYKSTKVTSETSLESLDLGSADISIERKDASISLERDLKSLTLNGFTKTLPQSMHIALNNRFTAGQIARFREDAQLAFSHPLPYFFCGSFLFPAALRAVTHGRTLRQVAESMTPAALRGFKRHAVRGMSYPAMLPSTNPSDEVHGMMVFGMLDSQRKALHAFQSGMFDLRRVKVEFQLVDGETIEHEAGVYVWNGGITKLVPTEERQWEIGDLLESEWFSQVISGASEEEQLLEQIRLDVV